MTRTILFSLGLAVAVPAAIAARTAVAGDDPPPAKTAKAAEPAEPAVPAIKDADALDDDIIAVITLPLAADDAREAGVDAAEVEAAIDAVDAGGGSPGEATEVLTAEADATRKRGAKKGFGLWVRSQVADGKRGKDLAALIKKKKAEYKEMSDEEKAEIDAKLVKFKGAWIEHRKQLHARRVELVKAGKKAKRHGEAELKELQKKLAKNENRQKRLDDAIAADPARKAELEKLLKKIEKRADKLEDIADKVEDKLDKAEDKADKAEDKLDKAEDKKDKAEDKKEARDEKKEAKEDAKAKKKHDGKHDGKGG